MKKNIALLLLASVLAAQCQNASNSDKAPNQDTITATGGAIIPVKLPSTGIDNFTYPQDSNVINGWVKTQDDTKIAQHGWGIWTALNTETDQVYQGQKLRVFETWLTPDEMKRMIISQGSNKVLMAENVKEGRGSLSNPHQFAHAAAARSKAGMLKDAADNARVVGFVKYDPTAAEFTVSNQLLKTSVLKGMLDKGAMSIPDFPNTAMTLKPVFEIVTQDSLKKYGGYFKLNVWSGPPATVKAYPEGSWPGYVYIDPSNQGKGAGGVDKGDGRTPENTYNLTDFVYFKLDAQTAQNLKATMNFNANEGDIAVLVAMHVTSKEIKRWTWQTYWWAPDAVNPPAPSSSAIAQQKPAQLTGAPAHYAMSQAYTFIYPDQPLTGGNNVGTSIYAYNPYLEAGFDPAVLSDPAVVITNGKKIVNNYGVLTNCMSCHAQANYAPSTVTNGPGYLGDTYIDMNGSQFKGVLQLDFAWSIQGNLIND